MSERTRSAPRGRRRKPAPWFRRNVWWVTGTVLVLGVAIFLFWPRPPAYARYTDGVRPTVVFVWSEPTPHHPHG